MIRQVIAKRYAEAAYDIACRQRAVDHWSYALEAMVVVFSEEHVARIVRDARVSKEAKLKMVRVILGDIEPLALNFACLLVANGRTELCSQVKEAFLELVDRERGLVHALVTSAVPLSDDEQNAMARQLGRMTGQKVDITMTLDEGIIGGFTARIGDRLIDGSTRSKLEALRQQLRRDQAWLSNQEAH